MKYGKHIERYLESRVPKSPQGALPSIIQDILDARERLNRHAFPRNFDDVARSVPYDPTNDVLTEAKRLATSVRAYITELNTIYDRQLTFEREFLSGRYDSARSILDTFSADYGVSDWSLQATLILASVDGTLESIRKVFSDVRSSTTHPLVLFNANYLALRTEPRQSPDGYDTQFISLATTWSQAGSSSSAIADTQFHLNYHRFSHVDRLDYICWAALRLPVVDQMRILVRVLCHLITLPSPAIRAAAKEAIAPLAPKARDTRLTMLALLLGTPVDHNEHASRPLFDALDAYTIGDYTTAITITADTLSSQPERVDLYELNIRAYLHAHRTPENPFTSASPAHRIYDDISACLAKSPSMPASLERLHKLAYVYDAMRCGGTLFGLTSSQATASSPLPATLWLAVHATLPTPRLIDACGTPADKRVTLSALERILPSQSSLSLYSALLTGSALPALLPHSRRLKYSALAYERQNHHAKALTTFAQLREQASLDPAYIEDAVTGIYRCRLALKHVAACARHLVEAYCHNEHLIASIDLGSLIGMRDQPDVESNPSDIAWPILYYIHYSDRLKRTDLYPVFTAYDDLLAAHRIERPSQLGTMVNLFAPTELILFLRYVCIPEIFDSSAAFNGTDDLEAERLAVCQLLLQLDSAHADAYRQEIVALTTAQALRRAIHQVEERKVYVDTAGIANSADRALKEPFERFRASRQLQDERLRQTLERTFVASIGARQVIAYRDEAFSLFVTLFMDIVTRFISSNEYGLDFYLSARIRHGTLSGQIRRQFEALQLITRKDRTGNYSINDAWDTLFEEYGQSVVLQVQHLLIELSRDLDNLIDRVKSSWIQIRHQSTTPDALFDYYYSGSELLSLYRQFPSVDDFNIFLELCFVELWRRTERNLSTIRSRLLQDLRPQLIQLVDTLEAKVQAILAGGRLPRHFTSNLTSCRTGIHNDLEILAGWFNVVERQEMADFDFRLLLDTCIEVIRRLFPSVHFYPEVNYTGPLRCLGHTFAALFDVLFILLENVVKHSGSNEPQCRIEVRIDGDELVLLVQNPLSDAADATVVQERLQDQRIQLDSVDMASASRREGGSGYFKLHKLLRADLNRTRHTVRFAVDDQCYFSATIAMDLCRIRI
jgi:hypothetical protein